MFKNNDKVSRNETKTFKDKIFATTKFVGFKAERTARATVDAAFDIALDGAVRVWWGKEKVKNRFEDLNRRFDSRIQYIRKQNKK